MTAKEWIEKHKPKMLDKRADGGVRGCPGSNRNRVPGMDACVYSESGCFLSGYRSKDCTDCWDQEIPKEVIDHE